MRLLPHDQRNQRDTQKVLSFTLIKLYEDSEHKQILTFEKLEPHFLGGYF